MNEIKELNKNPNSHFTISFNENIYEWNFSIIGPEDTLYEYGIFSGNISFPNEYPNKPPKIKFTNEIFHPNIYTSGSVCISILHEGNDRYGYEDASERWSPSHSVNSIMMSIISMLSEPNLESPANITASKMYKDDYESYKKKIYMLVANSH